MEEKNTEIKFKDFLDKTTNLITLFGVFNALFIYSTTIKDQSVTDFLLPSFFGLSLFVWFELILFTLQSSNGSRKYLIFFGLICAVEIGLIWLFALLFSSLLILLLFQGIFFLIIYLFCNIIFKLTSPFLLKTNDKQYKNIAFILIFLSIIFSGFILKLSIHYLLPLIDYMLLSKK